MPPGSTNADAFLENEENMIMNSLQGVERMKQTTLIHRYTWKISARERNLVALESILGNVVHWENNFSSTHHEQRLDIP